MLEIVTAPHEGIGRSDRPIFIPLDSLSPLLANISSDPLLLGLAVAVITIILYSLYKIKRVHVEKENRLDMLLQELDEEDDEIVTEQPLFSNEGLKVSGYDAPNTLDEPEEKNSDDQIYGDEFESVMTEEVAVTPQKTDQTLHL